MAEFCVDCWNKINNTKEPESAFILDDDLCEGCGEIKPCIVCYKMTIGEKFYNYGYYLKGKSSFLCCLFCLLFFPILLYLKNKYNK
jgi:hypothetical protein